MLVEWDNATINLKYITHILRDYETMEIFVFLSGTEDGLRCKYENKNQVDKDYDKLIGMIKNVTNLSTDMDGRFLCSHCGAPN